MQGNLSRLNLKCILLCYILKQICRKDYRVRIISRILLPLEETHKKENVKKILQITQRSTIINLNNKQMSLYSMQLSDSMLREQQQSAVTPQNTIHVVFKLVFVNNHYRYAMSVHKLAKIHQIHEDNGYNFQSGLNMVTLEHNGVSFNDQDLYGVYQPHSNSIVISVFIDWWSI